jgi:hypothetical protein
MTKQTVVAGVFAALIAAPSLAAAGVYNIHVGGVCSTNYTNGKGAPSDVGHWAGETSISASVDQRNSMSTATSNMKSVLDTYCTGSNSCWIFTYSNGAAVVSRTLAIYSTNWNIDYVLNSGGNEGGSEIGNTGWVGEVFGGCQLAGNGQVTPSAHRNGWNHNDTNGNTIIGIAGTGTIWYSFGLTHLLLPGDDDSVVAFHSAGGMSNSGSYYNVCSSPKYSNHYGYSGHCGGESEDHLHMSKKFVCLLGGC